MRGKLSFGSGTVYVEANNVTIKDSNFTATTGYYAVQVQGGYGNTTVTSNTFNSEAIPAQLGCWVTSSGTVTVANNTFIDSPADGVDVQGGGVISGNYFSGSGYTSDGKHPDAIWITNSTAPMTISDNFIDWTTNPSSIFGTNDCVRITSEEGPVSNVTVTGNDLIGGSTSIDAGNTGSYAFSNISIADNYLGFLLYYNFMPGPMQGVTLSGNVIFDYTSPEYAASAWAAYEKAGAPTPNVLVSTSGSTVSASGTGPTTLYGSLGAHLFGGTAENNLVAGFGREFIFGGAGANVFTFINPNRGDSPRSLQA
ncbi:right-handed parallel beta-helix repeat-containing protein [Roseiarcus sp.]|uniref:right-handed parallel beta-helix repeat-containing protein n=1 Tax=Roseiarcus sp. TaxID=1969460 RepID=UPI003F984E61